MRLIIGGMAQGKSQYLKKIAPDLGEKIKDGEIWDWTENIEAGVINHLEKLIIRQMKAQDNPLVWLENYILKYPQTVFICNEVGCGIVPIDRQDRDYREMVGRACCMLAKQAECVIRVSCGIGKAIKGEWL